MLRRAKRHLPEAKAELLAKGFKVTYPLEGFFPPFQTNGWRADGDQEFLNSVTEEKWVLGDKLTSIQAALNYQKKVLGIPLFQIPVAFRLNPLSQDKFNDGQEATIADWIPDVPATDGLPVRLTTEADFVSQDRAIAARTVNSPIEMLAQNKYRSLLAYQFLLKFGKPWVPEGNPMWKVGDFGRIYAEADFQSLGMSPQLIAENSGGPTPAEQMRDLRLSWFWIGWLFDPSLTHSGPS